MDSNANVFDTIRSAFNNKESIKGTIVEAKNGGWMVDIMGVDAFLPKSHFKRDNKAFAESFVGKEYWFRIIELEANGFSSRSSFRRFIVSYFAHQFRDVSEGSVLEGKVLYHHNSGITVLANGIQLFIANAEIPQEKCSDLRGNYPRNSSISFEVVDIDYDRAFIKPSICAYLASLRKKEEQKRIIKELAANLQGGEEFDAEVVEVTRDGVKLLVEKGIPGFIPKDELRYGFTSVHLEAFIGEKRKVLFVKEEDGVFICSAKLLASDPYASELYEMNCDQLLSTLDINHNSFLGQVVQGNKGVMLFVNLYADSIEDDGQLLVDPVTGLPIKVLVPARVHNRFLPGCYYHLSLSLADSEQRKKDRTPYRFYITERDAVSISERVLADPYKRLVERSFFKQDSPSSNASLANLLEEVGTGLYDYKDRMFFELLQNADDASAEMGVQVILQSIDGYLLLSHNGMPFNRRDYVSITSAARSNKGGKKEKTGYKGIGFKSVFTDSKQVYLKTGGFFFKFDKENDIFYDFDRFYFTVKRLSDPVAQQEFLESNREEKEEFKQVDSIPWQLLPFWVNSIPEDLQNSIFALPHNVSIALSMTDTNKQKYIEAILGVLDDPKFMLFLRHTNRIHYKDKGHSFVLSKKYNDGITILQSTNPGKEIIKKYLVKEGDTIPVNEALFQEVGVDIRIKHSKNDKTQKDETLFVDSAGQKIQAIPPRIAESTNTLISYAISIGESGEYQPLEESHSMYAYLPMVEKRFPFPIYINADFVLKSNRQGIKSDNPWNHFLMHQIGANYVKWIAEEALIEHSNYLNLLLTDYFNESDVDMMDLARFFNRAYKDSIETESFILNDKNELVSQKDIILDTTGLSHIITPDQFCLLLGETVKRLPHPALDVSVLSKSIFTLITRIRNVKSELTKKENIKFIRHWICQANTDQRSRAYQWLIDQNDPELVKTIPLFAFDGKYRSYKEVETVDSFLYLDSAFNSIRHILDKIGFICSDCDIQSHPLYVPYLKDGLLQGNLSKQVSRIISRSQKEVALLKPEEKVLLYKVISGKCLTDKTKEECSQWRLFYNSDNKPCPLSCLMEAGADVSENALFSSAIIRQEEYSLLPVAVKDLLMSRDRIYKTTIVEDWNNLISKWLRIGKEAEWKEDDYAKIYGIVQNHYQSYHSNNPTEVIKTISQIEGAEYILSGDTFMSRESIFYSPSLSNTALRNAAEKMLNIDIPAKSALPYLAKEPFITAHKNWTQSIKDNVILSDEEILAVLQFCKDNGEHFFKSYVVSCTDNGNSIDNKGEKMQFFSEDQALSDFVLKNLSNTVRLPLVFKSYASSEGLLSGDSLFEKLFTSVDLSTHKEELLGFVISQSNKVKEKFVVALGQFSLSRDTFTGSDFYKQLFSLCGELFSIELSKHDGGEESVNYLPKRSDIQIIYNDEESNSRSRSLSDIPLQGIVTIGERAFDMDDLNPAGLQAFQCSARELLSAMRTDGIDERYLKRLFELDATISPDNVFVSLNKANELENGSQVAFMLRYIMDHPVSANFKLGAKNGTSFNLTQRKRWYVNNYSFVDDSRILATKYDGVKQYLIEKDFKTIPLGLKFMDLPDTFEDLKASLTESEQCDLLTYLFLKWKEDTSYWDSNSSIDKVASVLGINASNVVLSEKYSLPDECLPSITSSWVKAVKEEESVEEKKLFVQSVFSLNGEDSFLVKARRFLSLSEPFEIPEGSVTKNLQDKICKWISEKKIRLSEPQYSRIKGILDSNHMKDSVDIKLIDQAIKDSVPSCVINHYKVFNYPGIIPRHVYLCTSDAYEFYSYENGDYCVDNYRIIISDDRFSSLRDILMRIATDPSNGFNSSDFLAFMTSQNDGSHDENEEYVNLKARCEAMENEIRKYQSFLRLNKVDMTSAEESYRGLDPDQMADALKEAKRAIRRHLMQLDGFVVPDEDEDPNDWTTIKGVKWNGEDFTIIVRSYRDTESRSFELNPDEWIKLMEGNAMLWIYTKNGPECFPFRDLVKNKSRISLSFSTINTDYPRRMLALAEILRFFKSLHFDFGPGLSRGHSTAERFIKPEKELREALKEDDEGAIF